MCVISVSEVTSNVGCDVYMFSVSANAWSNSILDPKQLAVSPNHPHVSEIQPRCTCQRAQLVRQTDAPGTVRTGLGTQLRVRVEVQGSAHINTEEPTFDLS